jgi:hypothetical protein
MARPPKLPDPEGPPGALVVNNLVECIAHCNFEYGTDQIFLRARTGPSIGSILRVTSPLVRAHPELFRPLVILPEYDHLEG